MFSRETLSFAASQMKSYEYYGGMAREHSTKEVGAIGENVAAEFLRRKGFEIVEKNYRKPWGEIDIIAVKSNIVRFVEVKSVSREPGANITLENNDHRPEELVHEHKLQKVARTAEMYMNDKSDSRDYQIDV